MFVYRSRTVLVLESEVERVYTFVAIDCVVSPVHHLKLSGTVIGIMSSAVAVGIDVGSQKTMMAKDDADIIRTDTGECIRGYMSL